MIDDDRLAAVRISSQMVVFDFELAARLEAEGDLVVHGAGNPAVLGDARHRGEAHARRAAHDIEDLRHHIDLGDRGQVVRDITLHSHSAHTGGGRNARLLV